LSDIYSFSHILSTPPEILAKEIWMDTFYYMYIDDIWDNAQVWRFISMFCILQLIFYKKKIRFFTTKTEKTEKDKNIFINADLILTEEYIKEFLIELSINETYHKVKLERFNDFCNFFQENKYFDEELNKAMQDFCQNLCKLKEFLGTHFFEIHIPGAYRLYPDLKNDPDFNYAKYQEELSKLCKTTELLYTKYKISVKSKLAV